MRLPNTRQTLRTLVFLAIAGCGELPETPGGLDRPALAATSGSGLLSVKFLPPLVSKAGPFTGTFDPDRKPVVQVVCTGATDKACPVIASFRRLDRNETHKGFDLRNLIPLIAVDRRSESYDALWLLPVLTIGKDKYQLRIYDEGELVDKLDLSVVKTLKEASQVPAGYAPLINGFPFLIRFRMERHETAPPPSPPLILSPAVVTLIPGEVFGFAASELAGGVGLIPAEDLLWSSSNPTVATAGPDGRVKALALGITTITGAKGARTGTAKVTVTSLPAAFGGNLGNGGGTVAGVLPDGARLEVIVPPDALQESATFLIEPVQRTPGANASFRFTPSGRLFGKPVKFAYNLPAGTPPGGALFLYWGQGVLPLLPDGPTGRVAASTRLIGKLPTFSRQAPSSAAFARGLQPASGLAQVASGSETVSVGSLPPAELIALSATALDALKVTPTLGNAAALMNLMAAVARARFQPGFPPAGDQLLNDWRLSVCARLQNQTAEYRDMSVESPFDFPDFFAATDLLIAWAGPTEQTREPALDLPFSGCPGGIPNYVGVIEERVGAFIQRIPELVNPPGRDVLVRFDEMIDTHLQHIITLQGNLQFLGLPAFEGVLHQISAAMLDRLRATAWVACRDRNDQSRLSRLMDLELQGAEEYSGYIQADLRDDFVGCTTELVWRTRLQSPGGAGALGSSGALGGTGVGALVKSAGATMARDHELVIGGRVQLMLCPGDIRLGIAPQENVEQLVVTARTPQRQGVLATRTVGLGGPREYFHLDSLVITPAAIDAALGVTNASHVDLTVDRVGNTCPGSFNVMGPTATLGVVALDIEDQCAAPSPAFLGVRRRASLGIMAAATGSCATIAIVPQATTVPVSGTRQFAATVTGTANTAVTWSATGGAISSNGRYTAGGGLGDFTVTATSVADPNVKATATVHVVFPFGFNVIPTATSVPPGKTRAFQALGAIGTVTWGAEGGSISAAGIFTAGSVEGEFGVTAGASNGFGTATVVVDRFVGTYTGGYQRLIPSVRNGVVTISVGRTFGQLAAISCPPDFPCYATQGQIDLGSVVLGQCYFWRTGPTHADGYCDSTSTSNGGDLSGDFAEDASWTWTLKKVNVGTLIESWTFSLGKVP